MLPRTLAIIAALSLGLTASGQAFAAKDHADQARQSQDTRDHGASGTKDNNKADHKDKNHR